MIAFSLISGIAEVYVLFALETNQLLQDLLQISNKNALIQMPMSFHYAYGLVGTLAWVIAGIFMLRAENWARWLALGWGLSVLILTLVTSGMGFSFYAKSVSYLVIAYFLVNGKARTFFVM